MTAPTTLLTAPTHPQAVVPPCCLLTTPPVTGTLPLSEDTRGMVRATHGRRRGIATMGVESLERAGER
eukprot:749146-Hanusia_phi.AAC.2